MERALFLSLVDDSHSARSLQKAIGPSEIGGCRRRAWHRISHTPTQNDETLSMAAWMGTAIHKELERRLKRIDPFGARFMLEQSVGVGDLVGHVDCYDGDNREVIDWKTTTKRKLSSFPSEQQRWQVQVYGYLMNANGYPVETVTLVGIPRDGNELDVKIHSEPYDRQVAEDALAWLDEIIEWDDEPPEPEMPVRFCRDYCQFYNPDAMPDGSDGCGGK